MACFPSSHMERPWQISGGRGGSTTSMTTPSWSGTRTCLPTSAHPAHNNNGPEPRRPGILDVDRMGHLAVQVLVSGCESGLIDVYLLQFPGPRKLPHS